MWCWNHLKFICQRTECQRCPEYSLWGFILIDSILGGKITWGNCHFCAFYFRQLFTFHLGQVLRRTSGLSPKKYPALVGIIIFLHVKKGGGWIAADARAVSLPKNILRSWESLFSQWTWIRFYFKDNYVCLYVKHHREAAVYRCRQLSQKQIASVLHWQMKYRLHNEPSPLIISKLLSGCDHSGLTCVCLFLGFCSWCSPIIPWWAVHACGAEIACRNAGMLKKKQHTTIPAKEKMKFGMRGRFISEDNISIPTIERQCRNDGMSEW